MSKLYRTLIILSVVLLTLYPIIELTRMIILYRMLYCPLGDFCTMAEIVIMWVLYLAIVPFLNFALSRIR